MDKVAASKPDVTVRRLMGNIELSLDQCAFGRADLLQRYPGCCHHGSRLPLNSKLYPLYLVDIKNKAVERRVAKMAGGNKRSKACTGFRATIN